MTLKNRIQSVDFLRGLTIVVMILVNTPGDWGFVYKPLLHAKWNGLTIADFVFPFFLYIVGISISFVYKAKTPDKTIYKKIAIRSLKLIGLGLFLNAFLPYIPFVESWEKMRIPGVLQRIGIVFFVTSVLYLNMSKKGLMILTAGILVGYWIWLGYIPFPGGDTPTLERAANNWANYLDLQLLGTHMWKPDYDPEGIISTIPSIASALTGVFIGEVLTSSILRKHLRLLGLGSLLLGIGYIWSLVFPLNKALWSSSFVLVTSGYATLILALIYYLTDYKEISLGNMFTYVGSNAIVLYFSSMFISKTFYLISVGEKYTIHSWLYETVFVYEGMSKEFSSLLYALVVIVFYVVVAYVLYRKRIFIKV